MLNMQGIALRWFSASIQQGPLTVFHSIVTRFRTIATFGAPGHSR
jgi:hypothetical protein